jgi:hypothetical protein
MLKIANRLFRALIHRYALHSPEPVGSYACAYIVLRDW